jgi:hypothetical protein
MHIIPFLCKNERLKSQRYHFDTLHQLLPLLVAIIIYPQISLSPGLFEYRLRLGPLSSKELHFSHFAVLGSVCLEGVD